MDVDAHVTALDREGRMLVDAARRADLETPVPTCPDWRLADLLAHIGFVHRWATRYVATAITEMVDEPDETTILKSAPPEVERCDPVAQGHAALVGALRAAPADLTCWTFLAAPSPLAMWARRQAHETAVHRVDAELAAGLSPSPAQPVLAADGVDELLFGFFSRPTRRRYEVPGGAVTLVLEPVDRADESDGPQRWRVRVSESGIEAGHGAGPGDVAVRGTASDLYLLLWHRRPLEGLEVEGSTELFERAWGARGVTWA
jgi:uncharacterized protein (TIGR03083 family)